MDALFESVAALIPYRSGSSSSINDNEGNKQDTMRDTMRDQNPMTSCPDCDCGVVPTNTPAPAYRSRPASPEDERVPRDGRGARDDLSARDDRGVWDDRAARPAPPPRASSASSKVHGQHMTSGPSAIADDKVETLRKLNNTLVHDIKDRNAALREKDADLREKDDQIRERDLELLKYSQDYARVHKAWRDAEEKLSKQGQLLATLQQEALAKVDRHEPTFDATVIGAFIKVNRTINSLVRKSRKDVVTLVRFVEAAGAASTPWREGVVPAYCVDARVPEVAERTPEVLALLLRALVWKVLQRKLFEELKPFAVFGSSAAADLDMTYRHMFTEHSTNEMAAKWKALSARCLADYETKANAAADAKAGRPRYQSRVLDELMGEFAKVLHEDVGCRDKQPDEIQEVLRPAFEPVLLAAMELASLVAQERAGYSLVFPDLAKLGFVKAADDPDLTNRPTDVGMNASGEEDELEGPFALAASPMLIKWGTGDGERLNESTVLCKAFVWRPRED